MNQLSKAKVKRIAKKLAEHYGEQYIEIPYEERMTPKGDGYYGPWVFPGSHEESNSAWIISWEMCPEYEWSFGDPIDQIAKEVAPEFYAEAINHFAVAFYEG